MERGRPRIALPLPCAVSSILSVTLIVSPEPCGHRESGKAAAAVGGEGTIMCLWRFQLPPQFAFTVKRGEAKGGTPVRQLENLTWDRGCIQEITTHTSLVVSGRALRTKAKAHPNSRSSLECKYWGSRPWNTMLSINIKHPNKNKKWIKYYLLLWPPIRLGNGCSSSMTMKFQIFMVK